MSDTYTMDETEEPPVDPAPDEPAADQPIGQSVSQSANSPKQSQQEANYREGNPQRSCGLCGHFDSKGHSCDVVEGEISPFGFSDSYLRQDNPFREGEKDSFKGGTKVSSPTAIISQLLRERTAPPPGLLQIGRRSYGGEA